METLLQETKQSNKFIAK